MRGKRPALIILSLVTGCSLAPPYRPPTPAVPREYKEASGWKPATPLDGAPRGRWWRGFGDPVLDDLEARAEEASPSLGAALARYDQARAVTRVESAGLLPEVDAGADARRERLSANRPGAGGLARTANDIGVGASLDYELDLWGRIRNRVRAARAEARATEADLASARLSLQAAVADAYARLRGLDAQAQLLRQTVSAYERAFDLTIKRHDGGIASGVDINRAMTVLGNARAQVSAVANDRAATEHEIAALVGATAPSFSVAPRVQPLVVPEIPSATPSELMQRRPDIAAAERRMFAANARVGVARAAFFPSLTLGLSGGFEAAQGSLLASPSSYWALGPAAAALTIFDAGRRAAGVKLSRAQYREVAERYRQTVITAFREAEDAIAAARWLDAQRGDQQQAAEAATRTSELALTRYRDGAADYFQVVSAQTDALSAQRALLSVETQRIRASVALVRALGGDPAPSE